MLNFYPIVPSFEWCQRLVPLGLRCIQLRLKELPLEQIKEQVIQAKILCSQHQCLLVLNDYWELALEHGLSAVHLGFEDVQTADVAALQKQGLYLGLSTHSDEELDTALAFEPSYIALGPILPTTLKKMRFDPQGFERITEWRVKIPPNIPLVAIGGLTLDHWGKIQRCGAQGIAVVSDVLNHPNPEDYVKKWLYRVF